MILSKFHSKINLLKFYVLHKLDTTTVNIVIRKSAMAVNSSLVTKNFYQMLKLKMFKLKFNGLKILNKSNKKCKRIEFRTVPNLQENQQE